MEKRVQLVECTRLGRCGLSCDRWEVGGGGTLDDVTGNQHFRALCCARVRIRTYEIESSKMEITSKRVLDTYVINILFFRSCAYVHTGTDYFSKLSIILRSSKFFILMNTFNTFNVYFE